MTKWSVPSTSTLTEPFTCAQFQDVGRAGAQVEVAVEATHEGQHPPRTVKQPIPKPSEHIFVVMLWKPPRARDLDASAPAERMHGFAHQTLGDQRQI
eukprot:1862510-Amphidinium_carterae.1